MTHMDALTVSEQDRLEHCVAIVRRGQQTFLEVASALAEIRDGRLYRATHSSFVEFARETFGFEKSHAHRLAAAGEIAVEHPEIRNENQARELARVPKDRRAEVIEQSKRDGVIDAQRLRENARAAVEQSPVGDSTPTPSPERPPVEPSDSSAGEAASGEIVPDESWFGDCIKQLREVNRWVAALAETPAGAFISLQRVQTDIDNAILALKAAQPTRDCYACAGAGCKVCRTTGRITELLWKHRPESVR